MTKTLLDKYQVNSRYQRSARIDTDWKSNIVDGYILHETARNVIIRLCEQFIDSDKAQKSFTITGPYGSGKSSLALIISNLVSSDIHEQKKTLQLFRDDKDKKLIQNALNSSKKGWVIIRVVGSRANPVEAIFQATKEAVKHRWKNVPESLKLEDTVSLKKLIAYFEKLNDELLKSDDGIMLIIDEMGKFLEHAAYDNGDIFVFQEIAERFDRSKNKNLFFGILHQSFGEYAKSLNKVAQEEWHKIQGRFSDLPFSVGIEEVLQLVGRAIEGPTANSFQKEICKQVAKSIEGARLGTPKNISQKLSHCIPLHPSTALLLGPISRRRFGQNERSIFSFLTSGESYGLNHFLKSESSKSKNIFTPDLLWNYLQTNLEPIILSSPDGHLWSEASEALSRVEKKGTQEHIKMIKALALIEIFGKQFGIRPTNEFLRTIFLSERDQSSKVTKILQDLEKWSIIVYRKHQGAWGLFAGSDIDLEKLIHSSIAQIGPSDSIVLQSIPDQNPVVAKEHYHKTGTLRWLELRTVFSNNLLHFLEHEPGKTPTGQLILVLKEQGNTREDILSLIEKANKLTIDLMNPIVFGCPNNNDELISLASELAALEKIQSTNSMLAGDAVARKELTARVLNITQELNEAIKITLANTEWFYKNRHFAKVSSLSQLASSTFNDFYPDTPIIKNELINREKISGASVHAAKNLLKQMIQFSEKESFGIEGYPPEKSIYLSLLKNTKIHRHGNAGYELAKPANKDHSLHKIWLDTLDFLEKNRDRKVTLNELFSRWSQPPYGMRQGIMPILAIAIFEAHQEKLALFVDDLFFPDIDDYTINRLYHTPDSISFRFVELAGFGKKTLKKVAEIFQNNNQKKKENALEVTKLIVQFVLNLKPLVKRTDRIKPQTLKIRTSILNGKDPFELLFKELPAACGMKVGGKLGEMSEDNAKKFPLLIKESLNELKKKELEFEQELKEAVYSALGYDLTEEIDTHQLAGRASRIKGISGDFSLEAFINVVIKAKNDPDWITNLASLAAEKPVANWFDLDFDRAKYELYSLTSRFKRVENHVLNNSVGKGIYSISAVTSLEDKRPKEVNLSVQLGDRQIDKVNEITKKVDSLLSDLHADEQIKLAVMSTLLNNAKIREETKKKKGKIN